VADIAIISKLAFVRFTMVSCGTCHSEKPAFKAECIAAIN